MLWVLGKESQVVKINPELCTAALLIARCLMSLSALKLVGLELKSLFSKLNSTDCSKLNFVLWSELQKKKKRKKLNAFS